ncbi:MAG: hypothetical protein LBT09_13060 [Planctomycetaceae bacterium]|nr:hypothetical protein [Planctomycetaceae bacterium]
MTVRDGFRFWCGLAWIIFCKKLLLSWSWAKLRVGINLRYDLSLLNWIV